MAATTNKDKFAVISRFEKLLKAKGRYSAPLNKYAEQWAADGLIQSFGIDGTNQIMDYYFEVSRSPSWKNFAFKAADFYQAMIARDEDRAYRAAQRRKMREWLDESGS